MKLADSLVLLGVAALPLAAPLADDAAPKPRPPVLVIGRDVAPTNDDASAKAVQKLIGQLGSDEADERRAAFDALAGRGEKARAALEEARKSDDPETRFSATQLLDRLDQE